MYPFSSLFIEFCIEMLYKSGFHLFFFFPSLHLVLCYYISGRLIGSFDCLISFSYLIFVLRLIWLLARLTFSG
jgi:hypothetical protein